MEFICHSSSYTFSLSERICLFGSFSAIMFPPKGILKSSELYMYIHETSVFPREPEPLRELRKLTESHPLHVMATTPDSGQLLSMLLKLLNAKKAIEVGVFTGYSLLLTALSIPDDGKIVAIDPNLEDFKFGLPVIQKAGVEHKIDFTNSEGLPVLDKLLENPENEGSFDFAFVDADKNNSLNYHERLLKLVKVGGIIVHDNTLWAGTVVEPDEEVHYLLKEGKPHAINLTKALVADPRIEIAHVSVGDGMIICRRLY